MYSNGKTKGFATSLLSLLFAISLSPACVQQAEGVVISPMVEDRGHLTQQEQVNEQGLACLRLRIDQRDRVSLIETIIVGGRWQDNRTIPVGPKLFYNVKDSSGATIASGYRKDPRGMHVQSKTVDFMLSVPYTPDTSTVELYSVGYEDSGKDEYVRNYILLGSFEIGEKNYVSR